MVFDRRAQLEQDLEEAYKLLSECEGKLLVETRPLERRQLENQRKQIKANIEPIEKDLAELPPALPEIKRLRESGLPTLKEAKLVGREEELARLEAMLAQESAVVITGLAGQGKTTLAQLYLRRLEEQAYCPYRKLVGYSLRADFQPSLSGLFELFFDQPAQGLTLAAINEAIAAELAQGPAVLVLDNAEDWLDSQSHKLTANAPQGLGLLVERLANGGGAGKLILTSRERPRERGWDFKRLALGGLSDEQGAALLQKYGVEAPAAQLHEANHRAGGNPFALILLADLVEEGYALVELLGRSKLWQGEIAENLLAEVWEKRLGDCHDLLKWLALLRGAVTLETLAGVSGGALTTKETERLLLRLQHKEIVDYRAGEGYSLNPLVQRFVAEERLSEAEKSEKHQAAANYFISLIPNLPPKENYGRKKLADAWPILEAVHHLNEMGEYDRATELFSEQQLEEDLARWGEALRLVEIYRAWANLDEQPKLGKSSLSVVSLYLGHAYRALGRVEEAIKYYQQALAFNKQLGRKASEGANLGSLGLAYSELGRVEEAITYYQQALEIAREMGDKYNEGIHLGNLGLAYSDLGQVEQAITYYQQALLIAREVGDRRGEGADLGNLGLAYSDLGQIEQAIEYYLQSLSIVREIGNKSGEGACLGNLGLAYSDLGQVEQAMEYYQQALLIAREIGDRRNEGNWLGNLGNAHSDLGQVEQAIEYYQQALLIAREIGDRRGEGKRLGNLGNAYEKQGEIVRALAHWRRAVEIRRAIKNPTAEKVQGWIDELQEKVGEAEFERLWAESEEEYRGMMSDER